MLSCQMEYHSWMMLSGFRPSWAIHGELEPKFKTRENIQFTQIVIAPTPVWHKP